MRVFLSGFSLRQRNKYMIVLAIVTIFTYFVMALFIFGDLFTPFAFLTIWSGRLGADYWLLLVVIAVGIAASVFFPPLVTRIDLLARAPLFVLAAMALSVLIVGFYADWKRRKVIENFSASHVIQHSFFRPIREAPRDFQFYLHAAALKDCVPYAWSYREMSFYALKPSIARNVLPVAWRQMCAIP